MKVLFATSTGDDYVSSCLWDGLQELLGEENVWDARNTPTLHHGCPDNPCSRISNTRAGRIFTPGVDRDFDLMVLNACFLRDHDWHWAHYLRTCPLRPGGKVAYVEGWDSANEVHDPATESNPPFPVDAIFRREIDPGFSYPYQCHSLMMAAPARWFSSNADRPFDLIYCGNAVGSQERWDVIGPIFQTRKRHRSLVASMGFDAMTYFERLRQFKLGLAPPGGGCGADCLRTWELSASGVIPIFVGYPPRIREPWFMPEQVFMCEHPAELPDLIDRALDMDLTAMRQRMQAHALEYHTTKARAKRLLKLTGMELP